MGSNLVGLLLALEELEGAALDDVERFVVLSAAARAASPVEAMTIAVMARELVGPRRPAHPPYVDPDPKGTSGPSKPTRKS